jgi:hypothetical protein
MQAKKLDVGNGVAWYRCGWNLFKRFAAVWILLGVAFLLIAIACYSIPFLGPLLFVFMLPALSAGFLLGADEVERGDYLDWLTLWAAFRNQLLLGRLLALGGLLLGLMVVASIIALAIVGGSLPGVGLPGGTPAPHFSTSGYLLGFGAVLLVEVAAAMCVFFAVPLVTFGDMGAVDAVRTSFGAAVRNIRPLLLFIIVYVILSFIAAVPFLLGFILLFPITFCSIYCAYREVFR